jgi:hypothetical protein
MIGKGRDGRRGQKEGQEVRMRRECRRGTVDYTQCERSYSTELALMESVMSGEQESYLHFRSCHHSGFEDIRVAIEQRIYKKYIKKN